MKKILFFIPLFVVLALAAVLVWQSPPELQHEVVHPVSQPANALPVEPRSLDASAPPPTGPISLQALPGSLQGTEVDGTLRVDEAGNLIISEDLRRIFDYFLSTIGEETLTASVTRLRLYLDSQLNEPARGQAQQLLTQYLTYKAELVQLERDLPQLPDLNALRQRQQAVLALQARLFDAPTQQAFFALEVAYNQFALDRLTIRHNPDLSDEEKGLAIDRLRKALPEEVSDAVVPQMQMELMQQTQQLQAQGASPEQIRQLRQQLVGNEATERLEALDAQYAQWDKRIEEYVSARDAILANQGLSPDDQRAAIEALASERFDERERLRLDASEQLLKAQRQN